MYKVPLTAGDDDDKIIVGMAKVSPASNSATLEIFENAEGKSFIAALRDSSVCEIYIKPGFDPTLARPDIKENDEASQRAAT